MKPQLSIVAISVLLCMVGYVAAQSGGCDGEGGEYDACGICAGDNSTCQCVTFHGFHIEEMDYLLLQWTIDRTLENIDTVLNNIDTSLAQVKGYTGDLDMGSVVRYITQFEDDCLIPYLVKVDSLVDNVNEALGLKWVAPGGPTYPGYDQLP